MFRKLNEYASAGLWDDRYNKPRLFLFGKDRQKAYELHDKMVCLWALRHIASYWRYCFLRKFMN